MCEVKRYGFTTLKMGKFNVLRMVKMMTILIQAMIGPIEFSAKMLRKKESAETVTMANAANPNAAKYRQKVSDANI